MEKGKGTSHLFICLAMYPCIFYSFSGPPEQGRRGRDRGDVCPPNFSIDVPFFLINPLNVLFLKEVTQNVHGNEQAKSRAT